MPDNPSQSRPTHAPDAAHTYERAKPERESPHGGLDQKPPAPDRQPDKAGPESTSRHTNRPNADSAENSSTSKQPGTPPGQVTHSMKDEEPMGWDQAPQDIHDPEQKRHPKQDGTGGA